MKKDESVSDSLLSSGQRALREKALSAGLQTSVQPSWNDDEAIITIDYPEARGTRSVQYEDDEAIALLATGIDLAEIRFIPDVAGFFLMGSSRIEVHVRTRQMILLRRIPGVEVDASMDPEDATDDGEQESVFVASPQQWKLNVTKGDVSLTLATVSAGYRAVMAMSVGRRSLLTLTVEGGEHSSTSEAAEVLGRLADAFFFDLDVRYGVAMDLVATPGKNRTPRQRGIDLPPEFPTNKYHSQPIALYRYGRAAIGLPLLSFLAYYQVLEFFFPIFTQEEITKRVRQTLVSPRFNPNDEMSLLGLVNVLKPHSRSGAGEKEQLRSTIRRCMTIERVHQIVDSTEQTRDYFCGRQQAVNGLSALKLNSGTDIRDQVADRIYDIRCRVVHTKSDGGDGAVELLLPSSVEARSIGPDIELARAAAQEAIIAACSPLEA